jgi:NADH:ubiquinone reductase (H+-translocating)
VANKLRKQVVVIGGGFGGLAATRALARNAVQVTLVDRRNHHLFQPLLYQVAMAGLSPAEIAVPIRNVLRKQKNARVLLAEAVRINTATRQVFLREAPPLAYDFLVVATGAITSYFGHEEWNNVAPGLKDIEDAVEIRRRVLLAFEAAEREPSPEVRRQYLTFVVIGGGPTGVELAGAIAELASYVLARDFRAISPESTRVILLEGGPSILNTFAPQLSARANLSLTGMGVEVRTNSQVTQIDAEGVLLGDERIRANTVLWAAGVAAAPLPKDLTASMDRSGRIRVEHDCSLPEHPEIFCIGDAAAFLPNGSTTALPGVSAVAMQQGRFVARQIAYRIDGRPPETFVYLNKGSMATIGRSRAVAEIGKIRLSGFIAWLAWLLVHIYYLVDFRNRTLVIIQWAWSYLTYQRGARLITGRQLQKNIGVQDS